MGDLAGRGSRGGVFVTVEITRLLGEFPVEASMSELRSGSTAENPVAKAAAISVPDRWDLQAGIWLLVDDIERAHEVCQSDPSPTGSYWHAIVHRREGDYGNSLYWYRRAGAHPAMVGFDGPGLVRDVERAQGNLPALLERQRDEWHRLWEWCLAQEKR
jgi:hypothetical protein